MGVVVTTPSTARSPPQSVGSRSHALRRGARPVALYARTTASSVAGPGPVAGGDFLTSPEVGPLFGAVLAGALDRWWDELGRPDPFTVVEGGGRHRHAGPSRAGGRAGVHAGRWTYVLVERSAAVRARQRDHLPLATPALAFPPADGRGRRRRRPARRAGAPVVVGGRSAGACPSPASCWPTSCSTTWASGARAGRATVGSRSGSSPTGGEPPLTEVAGAADEADAELADAPGSRRRRRRPRADQRAGRRLARGRARAGRARPGRGASTRRGARSWPTGRRRNGCAPSSPRRGGSPLGRPRPPGHHRGRWPSPSSCSAAARAEPRPGRLPRRARHRRPGRRGSPDLALSGPTSETSRPLRARSRVGEAEALTDPAGLGGVQVLEWQVPTSRSRAAEIRPGASVASRPPVRSRTTLSPWLWRTASAHP